MIMKLDSYSHISFMLKKLHEMQKSSTFTDCMLVPKEGIPVQAHLSVLALAWLDLPHLLPRNDSQCSCKCCVPFIALNADSKTVQIMVELIYTGSAVFRGFDEEMKVVVLLKSLGLKWVLNKVQSGRDFNQPKVAVNPMKSSLGEGRLLQATNVQAVVSKSLFDFSSVSPEVLKRSREVRKSLPRKVKKSSNFDYISLKQPRVPISFKKKSSRNGINTKANIVAHSIPNARTTNIHDEFVNVSSPANEKVVKKSLIAPGTLMTNVDNHVKFFCSYCDLDITKFSKSDKESHWTVVHFSEQLFQFTEHQTCKLCHFKIDDKNELIRHVGVTHKIIYDLLSVVPPKVIAAILKMRLKKLQAAANIVRPINEIPKNNQSNDVLKNLFQSGSLNVRAKDSNLFSERRCNICDRIFCNRRSLRRHENSLIHKTKKDLLPRK